MIPILFARLVLAEVVLLRHPHGNDAADQHRDEIRCVYDKHAADRQLFSAERLLERVVLPDALWCDDKGTRCHDATSSRDYLASSLECTEGESVRCTVRIDCSELISSFWLSLCVTLAAIVGFIVVPSVFCDGGRGGGRRSEFYDRDTSL